MQITRAGATPSASGPAEYFTGTVRIDAPFKGEAPARIGGATVTFEPGARTAWHTHPLGQTLIVLSGLGRRRTRDAMSHIAIAEALDSVSVTWLEKVTDPA
jgi:quercetin dioxygenase-like cupin family protein